MRIGIVLSFVFTAMIAAAPPARGATVDPPQRIKVQKLDQSEVDGRITSFDKDGLDVMDLKKQTTKLSWDEFPPTTIIDLYKRLVRPKSPDDTPEKWLDFGKKLLT